MATSPLKGVSIRKRFRIPGTNIFVNVSTRGISVSLGTTYKKIADEVSDIKSKKPQG